jgi:xanthine dehydrogenase large subunit
MSRPDLSPLGDARPHDHSEVHVDGSARYVDDFVPPPGMLHGIVVSSPVPHGQITGIDTARAFDVPGVRGIYTASDVPGENNVGPVNHDEPLFAHDTVHCVGQPVAVVVGISREACRIAAERVEVSVSPLPARLSLAEGIAARDFIGEPHVIARGDVDGAMAAATHRLSGSCDSGGQDHFYLETHTALAIPGEDETVQVFSSTQHPSEVQALVAEVLHWGRNQVVVACPRMGGAFGGKETQAAQFACMAALAATDLGVPVKIWLDRDTDMQITGRRHPFHSDWEVGFDADGRIEAISIAVFSDAGWATDLSLAILDRGLFHLDNAYHLPALRFVGNAVRTHKTSNCAFRGFGGPQGMVVIEHIMERIAASLAAEPLAIRRVNLYGEDTGWHTPYGQRVEGFRIPRMVDEICESSDLGSRQQAVREFNGANRFHKRAIALTPVKFGISFTASFLNQAGALVLVYADGSVQLNHGGTEMGQGLYTKMRGVCAHALGTDLGRIRHMPTTTDKVPNTSATAASSGSDLNGMAIRAACTTLVERLVPVATDLLGAEPTLAVESLAERPMVGEEPAWAWANGKAVTFSEVVGAAYMRQIQLSAAGYYCTPDILYDRSRGQGKPFHYYAYGVGVSEVEVNGLTGEWRLLRMDILHDVGATLAADIDIGQVEGAFVQGLGWMTTEELIFADDGGLLSHSPSTYKIPAIGDVPADFRVRLLDRAAQPDVIYGSKAVGEPPFMLAIGTHIALSRAATAFGPAGADIAVAIPATPEAILMAVEAARQSG